MRSAFKAFLVRAFLLGVLGVFKLLNHNKNLTLLLQNDTVKEVKIIQTNAILASSGFKALCQKGGMSGKKDVEVVESDFNPFVKYLLLDDSSSAVKIKLCTGVSRCFGILEAHRMAVTTKKNVIVTGTPSGDLTVLPTMKREEVVALVGIRC